MFEKLKARSAKLRLLEEKLYEDVVQELNQNIRRDGLWAKALASSDGSEEKAKSIYIKLRVQSMKDEAEVIDELRREEQKKESERVYEENRRLSIQKGLAIFEKNGAKLIDEGDFWQGINSQGGKIKKFYNSSEIESFAEEIIGRGYWS